MNVMNIFIIDGKAADWQEAIHLCGTELFNRGFVHETFSQACIDREVVFPTGLPSSIGVAIPHADPEHVVEDALCCLRLENEVDFMRMDSPDEAVPAKLIFNMAITNGGGQLEMLKRLTGLIKDESVLHRCVEMPIHEMHQSLKTFLLTENEG